MDNNTFLLFLACVWGVLSLTGAVAIVIDFVNGRNKKKTKGEKNASLLLATFTVFFAALTAHSVALFTSAPVIITYVCGAASALCAAILVIMIIKERNNITIE